MRRRGFTLIELVVVIALIAILGTLLIIGIGKLQTNAKRQQTRQTFQTLQGLSADYDVNRRVPFGAGNLAPNLIAGLTNYLAMPAPGDVTNTTQTAGVQNDRFGMYGSSGNPAVLITRSFMAQMMAVPTVASSIGKLPSSQLMTFIGGSLPTASSWSGHNQYSLYSTASYTDSNGVNVTYLRSQLWVDSGAAAAGTVLYDDQPSYTAPEDPTFTTNAPPNYYFWMPSITVSSTATSPLPTPVLLDAWGNPIIFVMGGILSGTSSGVNVHSPDYHPFFASAGPDGNFSKGDDNLYSFEK